jgi:hypothetical protein
MAISMREFNQWVDEPLRGVPQCAKTIAMHQEELLCEQMNRIVIGWETLQQFVHCAGGCDYRPSSLPRMFS